MNGIKCPLLVHFEVPANTSDTKFQTKDVFGKLVVVYHSTKIYKITKYAFTTAGDTDWKDPTGWILFGSPDGGYTWTILDEKEGQVFERNERREYAITNTNEFRDFKISFDKPRQGDVFHLTELEILGEVSGETIPHSEFTASDSLIFLGESVTFTNNSTNANGYLWTFEGGTPATSTDENPTVVYNTEGVHEAKLQSSSNDAIDIEFIHIDVRDPNVTYPVNITADGGRISGIDLDIANNGIITRLIDRDKMEPFKSTANNTPVIFQYEASKNYILTKYKLTSPSDGRTDPENWTIYGSSDGIIWNSLDSRENETFSETMQTKEYTFNNTSENRFYKIEMSNSQWWLGLNEMELWGIDKGGDFPVAHFTSKTTRVEPGESVTFDNKSTNATSYSWTFEGGTPATSTDKNPTITFNDTGYFNVTLKAIKNGLIDSKIKQKNIGVYTPGDWADFNIPLVIIENEAEGHAGTELYIKKIKENGYTSIEDFVQKISLLIAEKIYYNAEDANNFHLDTITYKLYTGSGVSAKYGAPPHIRIEFCVDHLINYTNQYGEDVAFTEVSGILCHEMTHGLQKEPKGCGDYFTSQEFHAEIEGMAELARLITGGFEPAREPSANPLTEENPTPWYGGYCNTAFFYLWLSQTQAETDADTFLIDFNMVVQNLPVWSHDDMCQYYFNRSIESMWTQYQDEIPNFPWGTTDIISNDFNSHKNALSKQCQILPNFRNSIINYSIPAEGIVKLDMIDLKGRLIATLVDSYKKKGNYSVHFGNHKYNSGIYCFRLSAGKSAIVKKALLVK